MTVKALRSRGVMAAIAAAIASSVLGFVVLAMSGQLALAKMRDPVTELPVVVAIMLFWVPAFALVPAAILGWLVERPKARAMIARRSGWLLTHLLLSMLAALVLWLVFRMLLVIADATPGFMDAPSLVLLILVGLCSGIAWWFLVVEPGRRR